jgi:hypothetical protein
MPDPMTKAERDDLAVLAFALCRGLPKVELTRMLNTLCALRPEGRTDFSADEARKLYRRGKDLARREKRRAA